VSADVTTVLDVSRGSAPATGPIDAPITIVDWSDYSCGYCARVQETLRHLELLYPGQLRWVHRALPLDEDSTLALELARAAHAQGRFLPIHQKLYALHGRVDRVQAELIGREFGLDLLLLREALDTGVYKAEIAVDVEMAARIGITGTPTFFINGRRVQGSQSLRAYIGLIDQELTRRTAAARARPFAFYRALDRLGVSASGSEPVMAVDDLPIRALLEPTATYRVGLGLPGQQLGPDDAPVTIVEWSDFQCPYCARQARTLVHVRTKYGDRVRIAFRPMALAAHRGAVLAAEAAVAAAAQGKFWAFHDQVFSHFGHVTRADLEQFASESQLDLAVFRAALEDHRYRDAVIAETAAAEALGVDGTPTMFINGQPVVGARGNADMDALIDAHLERVAQLLSRGVVKADIYPLAMDGARGEELADPSTIPQHAVGRIELRAEDRGRAAVAACRYRDRDQAARLAAVLPGDIKRRVLAVCSGVGLDLDSDQ